MATYDPRTMTVKDTPLIFADGATCPGAIACAGNTSVTSTNVIDLNAVTFLPNIIPRVVVAFPKGLGSIKSGSTLAIRVNDCATSGGTFVVKFQRPINNEAVASGATYVVGLGKTRQFLNLTLYLSNSASTDDLSGYTYTAWIDPFVSG